MERINMIKKEKNEEAEKRAMEERQRARENAQLKIFFMIVGVVIVAVLATMFVINQMRHFDVGGVTFNVVKEIAPYQTALPVIYQGKNASYNFYLRNDPRKLTEEISFDGKVKLEVPMNQMVINITGEVDCNKDSGIAVGNLVSLYRVSGISVIKDENATCDNKGRYLFLQIEPGNETRIEQTSDACYTLYVNNCEILKGTERFMVETFEQIHKEWI